MEQAAIPAFVVIAIIVSIAVQVRGEEASRQHIESWAASEGLELVSIKRRWFWPGPFFLRTSESHRVFEVVVLDGRDRYRHGVVRVGGWVVGALSDRVDVEWVDHRR